MLPGTHLLAAGLLAGAGAAAVAFAAEHVLDRPGLGGMGILALLVFVAYTLPPLRLNYRGGGEWLEMLGVAVVLPWIHAYLQSGALLARGLWLLPGFAAMGLASAVASGLADERSDRAGGKRTVVSRLGNEPARRLVEALTFAGASAWALAGALTDAVPLVGRRRPGRRVPAPRPRPRDRERRGAHRSLRRDHALQGGAPPRDLARRPRRRGAARRGRLDALSAALRRIEPRRHGDMQGWLVRERATPRPVLSVPPWLCKVSLLFPRSPERSGPPPRHPRVARGDHRVFHGPEEALMRIRSISLGVALALAVPAAAQAQTIVNDNNVNVRVDCAGGDLLVNGNRNTVHVVGACGSIRVNGNHNTVTASAVGSIDVNGNRNRVTFASGLNGPMPAIADRGNRNSFTQSGGRPAQGPPWSCSPAPPPATVVVQAAPPPATVVVQPAPPPRTVVVQPAPPPPRTVVVQPAPAPRVVVRPAPAPRVVVQPAPAPRARVVVQPAPAPAPRVVVQPAPRRAQPAPRRRVVVRARAPK
ncbi:MAG: DUF3060 domain-containing protein [Sandaracinaceae bacterium]|nr:DUF3060 domain-containing protein [Sandaracinaceae bacterium]